MISLVLQKPFFALLVVLLVFNLTQRRHLDHGEQKRFASLGFAGLALLFYATTLLVPRFGLPDLLLLVPVLIAVVVGIRFKSALFVFKFRCVSCGVPLPISSTLYRDDNLCTDCRNPDNPDKPKPTPKTVDEIDWEKWKPDEDAVTCYIIRGSQILLIHKKQGLGAGKVNAPGGRIEEGETAKDAAIRECVEEVGVTPHEPDKMADLSFEFTDGFSLHCSVFFSYAHDGVAEESDEADPFWCEVEKMPFTEMWEDDRYWIPMTLEGKRVVGRFVFDGEAMLSKDIRVVESFD
jgi:8-oxo-dGTP diphosphatase